MLIIFLAQFLSLLGRSTTAFILSSNTIKPSPSCAGSLTLYQAGWSTYYWSQIQMLLTQVSLWHK